MKTCKNIQCMAEFEPTHGNQKYCTHDCYNRQNARNCYHKNPAAAKARSKKWALENPEKRKEIEYKTQSKRYIAGRLPPWMYS